MGDFKPTVSQQAAIELRGSSALLSAGAGSGKTKVLTERLMGFVMGENACADIDSFLIITFTRAAAAELRSRIMDELSSALAKDPGNRHLRRQSALCSRAQISTIHGFCAAILREYAQQAGITQDFKILDEKRASEMKLGALDRVLEQRYSDTESYPGFKALADTVGVGRDDKRLTALVLDLYEKMQSHARPEAWANEQKKLILCPADDIRETIWGEYICTRVKAQCLEYETLLDEAFRIMKPEPKIYDAYADNLSEIAEQLRELRRRLDIDWDSARDCLPITSSRLKAIKSPNAAISDAVKARRKTCLDAFKKVGDIFYSPSDKLIEEMRLAAPAMTALLDLTLDFEHEYAKAKRRAGFLDYSDLEHKTAELLTNEDGTPTALAESISHRYTEIMVDEYQDVSRVQDAIFSAVSKNGKNLFTVGDVKQSIYRFRLADPAIFTEKYHGYTPHELAEGSQARRILLQENFRSRREIIDCANAVFKNCMSEALGDIDYDENAALNFGATYYEGNVPKPELMLLRLPKAEEGEETPLKTECEARMAAMKIRALVEAGTPVTDKNGLRPIRYGDIAILMRSPKQISGVYRRVLTQNGIPVAGGQDGGFFSSIEISTVSSMLAIIDNPHQDIPLIAVLRSPAFMFTADELSEIRACSKDGDFYTALCACEAEKCRSFLKRLENMRETAADMSIAELLWYIYNELDITAICSAMSDGEQRRRNLMALLRLSEDFSASGYKGLHRFILWLRKSEEKNQEPSVSGGDADAVQIMSVHKSKGLEFPVVFLCDTVRRFNLCDSSETVLVHPVLGLGPKVTDLKRRVEYPTLARYAIKQALDRETRSEEMRLLYVALTRPKERLFITAALRDPEKEIESCAQLAGSPLSAEILSQCANPAKWLIYAALADKEEHLQLKIYEDESEAAVIAESGTEEETDSETVSAIENILNFSYPSKAAENLPSKITATELKNYEAPDEDAQSIAPKTRNTFAMPDFAKKDRPLSGTERGIATHLVLQYMDISKTDSVERVKEEISRLREKKFITERESEAVDAERIYRLFSSPVGKRIRHADKVTREFKFSLLCDAEDIFGTAEGEKLLMQGVVDCCIEENGELTVIDYKTDSVFGEDINARAAEYLPQVRSYADALERIFNKPVKECVLYFIRAGKAVSIKNEREKHESV